MAKLSSSQSSERSRGSRESAKRAASALSNSALLESGDEMPEPDLEVTQPRAGSSGTAKRSPVKRSPKKNGDNTDEELDGDSQDDSQDDENIYEVQKIVAKRIMNGRPEYYIRWKGYGRNYDSWEPVSCLDNCQVMLENFERHWKIIEEEDERKASKGKNGKKPGPASKKKVVEEVETKNVDVTPPKKAKKPEPPMIVGQKEILDKYGDVADFGILEKVQEIRRNGKCKVALLKFKDHEDPVLADYELIKENYASSVIAYYESVTTFKSPHKA